MLILMFATHPLRTYSDLYQVLILIRIFGFISSTYSYLYEPYSDLYQVLILTFTNLIRIYIKYLFMHLRNIFGFIYEPRFISTYSYLYEPYSDLYQVLILTFATHPLRTIFGFILSTYSYLYEPYSDLY